MLRGLRLNCFLAPLLPAVCAAIGIIILATQLRDEADDRLRRGLADWLAASAQRIESGAELPEVWAAHPHWQGLALLHLDEAEGLEVVEQVGTALALEQADPPLPLWRATVQAQSWGAGQVAAPVRRDDGSIAAILYGVYVSPAAWNDRPVVIAGVATLLLGLLLAWYLARRVYRPVEALDAAAQAALKGDAPDHAIAGSVETGSVAASVQRLAQQYRERARQDS